MQSRADAPMHPTGSKHGTSKSPVHVERLHAVGFGREEEGRLEQAGYAKPAIHLSRNFGLKRHYVQLRKVDIIGLVQSCYCSRITEPPTRRHNEHAYDHRRLRIAERIARARWGPEWETKAPLVGCALSLAGQERGAKKAPFR